MPRLGGKLLDDKHMQKVTNNFFLAKCKRKKNDMDVNEQANYSILHLDTN